MLEKIIDFITSFKLIEWVDSGISDCTHDWVSNFPKWLFPIKAILWLITRTIILIPTIFICIIKFLGWNIFWWTLLIWVSLELIYKFTENYI
jgi:hypothetical protein